MRSLVIKISIKDIYVKIFQVKLRQEDFGDDSVALSSDVFPGKFNTFDFTNSQLGQRVTNLL